MHDAHLVSNGELSSCGHQVTDLIVELRDSPNNRIWHFTPCNRNVRCEYLSTYFRFLKYFSVFRPAHVFQCYDIIGRMLPIGTLSTYIFPNRRNWILIGFHEVIHDTYMTYIRMYIYIILFINIILAPNL